MATKTTGLFLSLSPVPTTEMYLDVASQSSGANLSVAFDSTKSANWAVGNSSGMTVKLPTWMTLALTVAGVVAEEAVFGRFPLFFLF